MKQVYAIVTVHRIYAKKQSFFSVIFSYLQKALTSNHANSDVWHSDVKWAENLE